MAKETRSHNSNQAAVALDKLLRMFHERRLRSPHLDLALHKANPHGLLRSSPAEQTSSPKVAGETDTWSSCRNR